jgi:hypothetical protein
MITMNDKQALQNPFLFRFLETEEVRDIPVTESGNKEDEPTPEPTKKSPWGD